MNIFKDLKKKSLMKLHLLFYDIKLFCILHCFLNLYEINANIAIQCPSSVVVDRSSQPQLSLSLLKPLLSGPSLQFLTGTSSSRSNWVFLRQLYLGIVADIRHVPDRLTAGERDIANDVAVLDPINPQHGLNVGPVVDDCLGPGPGEGDADHDEDDGQGAAEKDPPGVGYLAADGGGRGRLVRQGSREQVKNDGSGGGSHKHSDDMFCLVAVCVATPM